MNHCVKSYAKSCKQGQVSIWSLQVVEDERRVRVLTVAVESNSRKINQIRGRFNMAPGNVKRRARPQNSKTGKSAILRGRWKSSSAG
jgi:hypothetical protein